MAMASTLVGGPRVLREARCTGHAKRGCTVLRSPQRGAAARASSGEVDRVWRLLSEARQVARGERLEEAFFNAKDAESAGVAAAWEAKELARELAEAQEEVKKLREMKEELMELAVQARRSSEGQRSSETEELRRENAGLKERISELESDLTNRPTGLVTDQIQDDQSYNEALRARVRDLEERLANETSEGQVYESLMEEKSQMTQMVEELERLRKENEAADQVKEEVSRLREKTRQLEEQLAAAADWEDINEARARLLEEGGGANIDAGSESGAKGGSKKAESSKSKAKSATQEKDDASNEPPQDQSVQEAPSSEQRGATAKGTQGTKEAHAVTGGDNGVGPRGSASDRLMPFKRNDFSRFRMPKRIFPSRARSVVPDSQTAESERTRPFSRNPASAFRLRKRLFVESTTGEEADGQVSSRARPFQRNDASVFQLRKRKFSPNSNRLPRTGASSSVESVPTVERSQPFTRGDPSTFRLRKKMFASKAS